MTPRLGSIPARTRLALAAGRAVADASRRLGRGRGGTVGGGVALWIDPAALRRLAAGRHVALVSATNGKSTTSRLLAEALGTAGAVAHNASGANMAEGLVTTL
ncbi:MAG TPA: DUF1727 domain-containing protein, partial [Patescibacteria group bacterium]|nr:DUF1727 domain-containing protein [Patescibacteria group bacterium]